jgi:SM-20-related protein
VNKQFDLLIDSYQANRVGIAPAFLSAALSLGLQQNIIQLQLSGLMKAAGIGNKLVKDTSQKMRSDEIYWLDKAHDNIFENEFLLRIENFITYLNRTCYTGINAFEFHYAMYEEGSFYKRHKDQFKNDTNRKYSLICYLNENWTAADGGLLQIFDNDTISLILPQSQTAVLFKSDETEHEVRKAARRRMSITGWLKQV